MTRKKVKNIGLSALVDVVEGPTGKVGRKAGSHAGIKLPAEKLIALRRWKSEEQAAEYLAQLEPCVDRYKDVLDRLDKKGRLAIRALYCDPKPPEGTRIQALAKAAGRDPKTISQRWRPSGLKQVKKLDTEFYSVLTTKWRTPEEKDILRLLGDRFYEVPEDEQEPRKAVSLTDAQRAQIKQAQDAKAAAQTARGILRSLRIKARRLIETFYRRLGKNPPIETDAIIDEMSVDKLERDTQFLQSVERDRVAFERQHNPLLSGRLDENLELQLKRGIAPEDIQRKAPQGWPNRPDDKGEVIIDGLGRLRFQ